MDIVTIFQDHSHCLSKPTESIALTQEGLAGARQIADQLVSTLEPLMPAGGLAAPQIGISKQIFIYSWDRTPQNIEVVINPSLTPLNDETQTSYEACFSTFQQRGTCEAAKIQRYKKIAVTYANLKGTLEKKILEGFAARAFQHEYDHLQGIVCTRKPGTVVETFSSKKELMEMMKTVKEKDSVAYIPPKVG